MNLINIEEANPFLRYAQILDVDSRVCNALGEQIAYDNRMFLCIGGTGGVEINSISYPLHKGSLIMWRAGMLYRMHSDSTMKLIGFNFDFTNKSSDRENPIFPDKADVFNNDLICEKVQFADITAFNEVCKLENAYSLKENFIQLKDVFTFKNKYYRYRSNALLTYLIAQIALMTELSNESVTVYNKTDEIIAYIHDNIENDLSNSELGKRFGYHSAYIGRLMLKATGMSTHQYVLDLRINKAIELLQSGADSVSEVCYRCGFKDLSNFSKYFKRKTGISPSKLV